MTSSETPLTADLVWNTPPADLVLLNEKKLRAMGVADAAVRAFAGNRAFILSLQTALVVGLERLLGTAGRADVAALAATLASEDEARFLVWTLQVLDRYQSSVGPVTAIRVLGRTLVARVPGGGLVVPAGVDYVAWTPSVAEFAQRAELQAVKDRAVWLSGRVSERARRELTALGWTVKDDVLPMK